jgi:iron complex outermembrane receptor protein
MGGARTFHRRRRLGLASIVWPLAGLVTAAPMAAVAQEQKLTFKIPAQPLSASLLTFGRQARLSVLAGQEQVHGRTAPEVSGDMTARQALTRLLAGSGLAAEFVTGGGVRIVQLRVANPSAARDAPVSRVARTTPWETQVNEVEPLVVTGTAIRGYRGQALPVTVIDAAASSAREALTPIELLTALPQIGAIPLGESTSGSLTARGDNAAINMRGIGSSATLVLLNGRRLAPHPISSLENGAPSLSVNVNQLPARGLERIDVLRDGASSLYGSDAVAGVINFVTTRRLRGTEVRARYGYPEAGGGKSWNLTATHGRDLFDGRGRLLTTLDLLQRDKIFLNQRDFSATADHSSQAPAPFNAPGSVFDGRLANLYPVFRVGAAMASTYFRPLGTAGQVGFTSLAPSRATDPGAFVDVNRFQEIQPRSARLNWFSTVEYDFDNAVTAFGELTVYRAHSQLIRNPVPFNAPNSDLAQVVSADNPYNPYGSRFYSPTGEANADGSSRLAGTPQALSLRSVLLTDGGADVIDVHSQVYRAVGGLRGKVGQTWSWETGLLYSWARSVDETATGFRESLLGQALARTDATAFNPFGYTFKVAGGSVIADQAYRNPSSVLSTIMRRQTRTGETSIASIDARASGELFQGWAGGGGGRGRRRVPTRELLRLSPAVFQPQPGELGARSLQQRLHPGLAQARFRRRSHHWQRVSGADRPAGLAGKPRAVGAIAGVRGLGASRALQRLWRLHQSQVQPQLAAGPRPDVQGLAQPRLQRAKPGDSLLSVPVLSDPRARFDRSVPQSSDRGRRLRDA